MLFRSAPHVRCGARGVLAALAVCAAGGTGLRVAVAQICPDPSFASPVSYATPASCRCVAVGDFNVDGHPDLVACFGTTTSANVGVLLNLGAGTFAPVVSNSAVTTAAIAAVGDFNADTIPDVAVTYSGTGSTTVVGVMFGLGNGTLLPAVTYPVGGTTRHVSVGDFNEDGKPDLAVATGTTTGISVLLNNGNGTFGAATQFGGATNVLWSAVADFNHDNHADLVLAISGGTISVLLGDGLGGFAAPLSTAAAQGVSVAAGDLNGDGHTDVVVGTSGGGSQVTVLLGDGMGGLSLPVTYSGASSPQNVAIADFNGDGMPDIVSTSIVASVSNSYVYRNLGSGTFQAGSAFPTLLNNFRVATGDFNGDGKPDFAVTSSNQVGVTVVLNTTGPCTPAGVCCRGATCNTTFADAAACAAAVPGGSTTLGAWSAVPACNATGNNSTPCCHADYDKLNGVQVADIFAMLNDWFAGYKFVVLGGDGDQGTLAVQNIFDFLNAWFAGCSI